LIGCPDRAFHGKGRILWRSCFAKAKTRSLSRNNRPRVWKKIAYCRWNDPRENSDAEQDSMANRTDKFPPGLCRIPETVRMKRKKLQEPFSKIKKVAGRSEKNGDRRFALCSLAIPPVNQPKI